MNTKIIAILALVATVALIPTSVYAEVLFSFGPSSSPAEMQLEEMSDGTVLFTWVSEDMAQYVFLQGVTQALTATDIANDDTRFYDVNSIEQDVSRIAFPMMGGSCIYVIEEYDGKGKFDVKSLLCS